MDTKRGKTVFVIGAGASVPYGFPDGRQLRDKIIMRFPNDIKTIIEYEKDHLTGFDPIDINRKVSEFIRLFEAARCNIDLFLTRRSPEYDDLGKIAIVNEILRAEKDCEFKSENQNHDWLYWFYNVLTEGILKIDELERILEWNYSFISFNYDRLLLKYIQSALMASWGQSEDSQKIVNDIVSKIPILHVYGSLGEFNWQKTNKLNVNFGKMPIIQLADGSIYHSYRLTQDVIKNIHIMHNDRGIETRDLLREELKKAQRVFFLGFAFAPENLKQLGIPEVFNNTKIEIYGTALNYTIKEINKLKDRLMEYGKTPDQIKLLNTDCLGLLREHLFDETA